MWPHQWKYHLYFFSRLFFFFFLFCACWCATNEPTFEEKRWKRLVIFCSQLVADCLIMRATLSGCLLPFIIFYISFSVNLPPPEPWPLTKARTPLSLSAHSSVWNRLRGTFLILFDLFFPACMSARRHPRQEHLNIELSNSQTVPPLFSLTRAPG